MRIIIITSSSNRSGGTRQAMYQADALAELGHEVFFCLPAKGSLWELAPKAQASETQTPKSQASEAQISEAQTPKAQAPKSQAPEAQASEAQALPSQPESKTPQDSNHISDNLTENTAESIPAPTPNPQWVALPPGQERAVVENLLPKDSTPTIVHAFHNRAVKRLAWWGLQWRLQDWWHGSSGSNNHKNNNSHNHDHNSPSNNNTEKSNSNSRRNLACLSHRGVIYRPGNPLPYLSPGLRAVLVNSMACGHKLGWHCPASKIKYVPNGVPSPRITPTLSPAATRELYQILPGDPVFIHVGGNNPAKGLDTLLEAFALAKLPTARLLLIGPDQAKWESLCAKLGLKLGADSQVQFLGRLENVANCLQLADVFIFASRDMDSAPNTLLEAMHLGLPVIATKVGGVPEIAQDNGILVPANDPTAMSVALKQMTANPELRQIFAKKSLELAKNYTMQKRCSALEEIYTQLLAN